MNNIKLFESFNEFNEESLKKDIDGILVELEDIGFTCKTTIYKTMGRDTINVIFYKLEDRFSDSKNLIEFNTKDISEQLLVLIDYIKYKLGEDIYIEYKYWNLYTNNYQPISINDYKNTCYFKIIFCEERVTGSSKW